MSQKKISDALKENRLLVGSKSVMKGIRNGRVSAVFFAENIPQSIRNDLEYYAKVSGVEVNAFKGNSAQLGELCGKPFKILLVGIKKE